MLHYDEMGLNSMILYLMREKSYLESSLAIFLVIFNPFVNEIENEDIR